MLGNSILGVPMLLTFSRCLSKFPRHTLSSGGSPDAKSLSHVKNSVTNLGSKNSGALSSLGSKTITLPTSIPPLALRRAEPEPTVLAL